MITLFQAIQSLVPGAEVSVGMFDQSIDWHNPSVAPVTLEQIQQEQQRLQQVHDRNEYQKNRAREYPSIEEQLDALYHAGVFPAAMAAKIRAVKEKYPRYSVAQDHADEQSTIQAPTMTVEQWLEEETKMTAEQWLAQQQKSAIPMTREEWLASQLQVKTTQETVQIPMFLILLSEARHELGWEVAGQEDIDGRVEQETWGVGEALGAGDPSSQALPHKLEGGGASDQEKEDHINQSLG